MTTISGFAEGILDGTIPPEKEEDALKIVVSETRRLSRLVRRMLDLSRLNALAESSITAQEQFDLVEVVSQVIISLEGKITERNLDMDVQMPEDKLMVWGDVYKRQVPVCEGLRRGAEGLGCQGDPARRYRAQG